MFEKIQSLYGQAFSNDPQDNHDPEEYHWFKSESGIPFGIKKTAVTEKEYQLLSLSFQPVQAPPKLLTDEERAWHECLFAGKANKVALDPDRPCFLLHIYFKTPLSEADSFREAIFALFDESPIILWKDDHTVLLVLKNRPDFVKTEELSQILAADFYSDVRILVGGALRDAQTIHSVYSIEEDAFAIARKAMPERRSYRFEKVLPLFLLSAVPNAQLQTAFASFFTAMEDEDPDWMNSLYVFLEHGMNMTAASKALYIHRNSLQYRIDKFSEKTGLDPKQFEDALYIYLGLLAAKLK